MSLCSSLAHSAVVLVPINHRDMRLIDFMREFPDEESCDRKLREYREAQGIVCPHCGCTEYYWNDDRSASNASSATIGRA